MARARLVPFAFRARRLGTAQLLTNMHTDHPEWDLLLTACSAPSNPEKLEEVLRPGRKPAAWDRILSLAENHGVMPLLHQSLARMSNVIPPETSLRLEQSFQTNIRKSLFLSRELIRIVESLTAAGIEVMPYKGLVLAEVVYGDIALRPAGDMDVLIHPTDVTKTLEIVGTLGYTPHVRYTGRHEREYLKSGYEYSFDGTAGPNLLEVQWALQPRFYAVDYPLHELFARAMRVEVAGYPMKTPPMEQQFLVLSLHAAKQVWGRLIWLCDLQRILQWPWLDWEWIGRRARELGVVRILQVTMALAERMLGTPPPAAAQKLARDLEAKSLAKIIEKSIMSDKAFNVESLEYFRLMVRLRERLGDRMKFASRLIFTPGPGEWEAVPLPDALFGLYRVVRLGRVAGRMIPRSK